MINSITTEQLIIEFMEAGGEDLERLPPRFKLLIERLLEERKEFLERIKSLEEQVGKSEEKAKQNSKNSSQPPSQDPLDTPKEPQKSKTTKKRGGQPGHKKFSQPLFEVEKCQEVVKHYPTKCKCCGDLLNQNLVSAINRHQYLELPKIELEIIEHQVYQLKCSTCGTQTLGKLPDDVPKSHYRERLSAFIARLRCEYHLSYQKVQDFLKDFPGCRISIGQIRRLSQEMNESLAVPVQEAQTYLHQQPVLGSDETSFSQRNGDKNNPQQIKGWLWVLVSPSVTYFQVILSRSQKAAQEMLGEVREDMPIVITDRYGGYNWIPLKYRQICWAHLKRDFTAISERVGASGEVGRALLYQLNRVFRWWHRFREGLLSYELFCEAVGRLRDSMRRLLEEVGSYPIEKKDKSLWAKTVRTCREILKVEEALWTFVHTPGVEPTNNASEQALRPAVIWRRISYGSQSETGSQFVARMLTVVTSLRKQNRSVFEFLVETLTAKRKGGKIPSLLPIT